MKLSTGCVVAAALMTARASAFQANLPVVARRLHHDGVIIIRVMKEPPSQDEALEVMPLLTPHPPKTVPPEQRFMMKELSLDDDQEEPPRGVGEGTSTNMKKNEQLEQLIDKMWATEQVLQDLQKNATRLQTTLQSKQDVLTEIANAQQEEETLRRHVDLQAQQAAEWGRQDKQIERDHEKAIAQYKTRQGELEEQVAALQKQLVETQMKIRAEQDTYAGFTQRLAEVDGTQDWESSEFEREKAELLATMANQQAQLESLQAQWSEEEAVFVTSNGELRTRLNAIRTELQQEESQLDNLRDGHKSQRIELQQSIEEQELLVREAQNELSLCRSNKTEIIQQLQQQIESSDAQCNDLQEQLRNQSLQFLIQESGLNKQLALTNKTCEELAQKLENQETLHNWEQGFMQRRIEAEAQRIQMIQTQLEKEQLASNKIRHNLHSTIAATAARQQSTAAKMMKPRFDRLRSVLTGRWHAAKREGRVMERSLKERYEGNVLEMNTTMQVLQDSVCLSIESRQKLQRAAEQECIEAKELWDWHKSMEGRMNANLQQVQLELDYLHDDQRQLQQLLVQKELEVEQLESSGRAILRAIWKLTRERLRGTRKRIFGMLNLQRRPKQRQRQGLES
jgi:hypothetical protein